MENYRSCQSCGMPLNKEAVKGTEKNGLKSDEYCMYCYENGAFKNPEMNLQEMEKNLQHQMKKMQLHEYVIQKAVNILPALKRWKN
ncbi:MAG TPA: zinc ribbon domain-containing protein [Flavobacterium sp.]|nr:zinc ribbon domain-containing protein [Flavobacterium sp.]